MTDSKGQIVSKNVSFWDDRKKQLMVCRFGFAVPYLLTEAPFFQRKKKEKRRLCKQGMPYQTVKKQISMSNSQLQSIENNSENRVKPVQGKTEKTVNLKLY